MKTVRVIVQGVSVDNLREGLEVISRQLYDGMVVAQGATERFNFQFNIDTESNDEEKVAERTTTVV